jgi:pyruvate/2-oxoacid:ferredoxin oxidoreductase beta subunit
VQHPEGVVCICGDNEVNGKARGHRSAATPVGAVTTTTPIGKSEGK